MLILFYRIQQRAESGCSWSQSGWDGITLTRRRSLRVNIKHFLRAFYFRLRRPENAKAAHPGTRESILAKLEELLPRMVRFW